MYVVLEGKGQAKRGPIIGLRRDAKPALSDYKERYMVECIAAMKTLGLSVARIDIMKRTPFIYNMLQKHTRPAS